MYSEGRNGRRRNEVTGRDVAERKNSVSETGRLMGR